ncbi:MAG: hypothetical protein Q8Q57_06935 [Methylotenera sp.]|nr:hypothetical protein [Methylococcaceae bacterium]MDP3818712.1 hypothetical protein [Methylotenera sp.]
MNDKDLPILREAAQSNVMGPQSFDPNKYLSYVDDPHLTDAQKTEFLQTLWTIMSSFVDLGFGVDSVMPILEQKALEAGEDALEESIPTHEFNIAAEDVADEELE